VYDVSNRESFEALPRWLEELENYVPPEVVKVVVGNKLDKVSGSDLESISPPYSPLLSSPSSFFLPTADARHSRTHARTPFRNTLDKCLHQKAQRSQRGRDVYSSRRPPRRPWV
jgi:GTPase SAR1 family protein